MVLRNPITKDDRTWFKLNSISLTYIYTYYGIVIADDIHQYSKFDEKRKQNVLKDH